MPPIINIHPNAEAVAQAAAALIAERISTVLQKQNRFTLALSGGSTPKRLHQILAASPYKESIDWSRVHIFWGDERYVPLEDERNNARMAYDTLLNHVMVPESQVHIMRTDLPDPRESAVQYEKILHRYFDGKENSFDLLILGMGDDGHTLSLFPGTEIVHETQRWCAAFFLEQQDMFRITITKTIANRSACILFLTTGKTKAPALKQVLNGPVNINLYPAQTIQPENGELHWIIDNAAAGQE
ncbi:6-phosphogluconolactonase [Flavihumibacter profundi]|jgi:6-phosphogluconolactonase|uniref:6-phosphogluconolactonase n=1 Tax=Flavihumibacter profundi TaxID=2716883 RepID=UPI001CC409C3|nr:6-phosphogluconolactonase [Flavihumibacter profundi]MBZ5858940.1 6-phosphogluconolactonase [Flavihumibacter profundi]